MFEKFSPDSNANKYFFRLKKETKYSLRKEFYKHKKPGPKSLRARLVEKAVNFIPLVHFDGLSIIPHKKNAPFTIKKHLNNFFAYDQNR